MLKVENISKSYGDNQVLKNISFQLDAGHSCAIIGPNGSGKTTMLNTISGLLPLQSGNISVNNYNARDQKKYLSRISTLVQNTYVEIGLTARQSVRIVCGLNGHYPSNQDIEYALDRLDILRYADDDFRMLSGGCKRRVMLAYTLLKPCDLLLLDEPTSSIDPDLRRVVWDWIVEIKKRGTSVIFSSHYSDEIKACADDILIIKNGEIFDIGHKIIGSIIVNISQVQNMPKDIPFKYFINNGIWRILSECLKDVMDFLYTNNVQYSNIWIEDSLISQIYDYMHSL